MDRETLKEYSVELGNIAETYYTEQFKGNESSANKIKDFVSDKVCALDLEDQKVIVNYLRDSSIDVNYHQPRESTGYGIIRDVYCENLLGEFIKLSKIKLSNIQSGTFSPDSIDDTIEKELISLPKDQFEAFNTAVENYQTPTYFEQTAKNRDEYAWSQVNQIMQQAANERNNYIPEESEL